MVKQNQEIVSVHCAKGKKHDFELFKENSRNLRSSISGYADLGYQGKAYKKHTQKFVFLIKNQKGRVSNRNSAQRTKPFRAQEFQSKMSFGVARFLGSPKTSFEVNTRITEKHGISWQLSSILEGQKKGQTFRKDV